MRIAGMCLDRGNRFPLHTYCTPLFEVSKLLRHASIQMTDRYAHLAPDHLQNAVDNLGYSAHQLGAPNPFVKNNEFEYLSHTAVGVLGVYDRRYPSVAGSLPLFLFFRLLRDIFVRLCYFLALLHVWQGEYVPNESQANEGQD